MLHFVRIALLLGSSGVILSSCGGSETAKASAHAPPAPLAEADMAAIRATDSAFVAAANAGDLDAVTAVYANSATLLPPNLPPQKGQSAIRSFWGGFLKAYTVKFEIGSDTIDGRGDLAYNVGRYRYTAVPKSRDTPGIADEGKFVEILKKQPDGSWKYVVDMYSSNFAQ